MAGIIDWVTKRLNRTDVEVASEIAQAGRRSSGRARPGTPRQGDQGVGSGRGVHSAAGTAPAHVDDGVYVSPTPITAGESVSVKYSGLLAKAGAEQVYLHMGYGVGTWNSVVDVPMTKVEPGTFEARVDLPLEETSRFHFCFRDNAGNWDNNNGRDWSYEIHNGELVT
ncbi:MAG: carbohydrate-binding protein [Firmicutes bacterium]|nr:carbohydrate-binding protein [Bacillota bacterium]MDH7494607.1 carbohydrate-binding protein [Bacillota bacterium]